MALTRFQQAICRLIAANRLEQGEAYVAGGVALNLLTGGKRISRDIDLFHDTLEALEATWQSDRTLLENHGYELRSVHERPGYVEALVGKGTNTVLMQWTRDSAFRFFPLVQHEELGLVLHPFDLATNKLLAMAGRLEIRDWMDVITCHKRIQPLGYLAWAACGKDPGFSPLSILEEAGRSGRYTPAELDGLCFDGAVPVLSDLMREWHSMLREAREVVAVLPAERAGTCVLHYQGNLFQGDPTQLEQDFASNNLIFHPGSIRGSYPQIPQ
ncbi:MAG: hypothetical protein JXM79_01075 [Sedimentisphaerales bacterium]|nr:hypothetical protein [Sedimentisphaerales bacterium]